MLIPFNIFLFYFLSLLTPWVHSPNLSSLSISFTLTFDLPTDLASNLVVDLSFDLIVTSFWSLLWSHCCIPPISLSDATFDKFFLIYFYGIPYNFFFWVVVGWYWWSMVDFVWWSVVVGYDGWAVVGGIFCIYLFIFIYIVGEFFRLF